MPAGEVPVAEHQLCVMIRLDSHQHCSKIAEAEAAVSVNKKKWLLMHVHVHLRLDELPSA